MPILIKQQDGFHNLQIMEEFVHYALEMSFQITILKHVNAFNT